MTSPSFPETLEQRVVETPAVNPRRTLRKALVLLLLAVAGGIICRFTPLKVWLAPAGEVAVWFQQSGPLGAAAFLTGTAVLILLGIPRLLFCAVAGGLYGFWGGIGLCIGATMLSYYLAFLFLRGRRRDGDAPSRLHPKLAFLAHDPGIAGVVISRLVPVPGMLVTLALSLSPVSHRDYVLGSLVGLIPEAAPLVLLGAGMLDPKASNQYRMALLALVCIILAWATIHLIIKRPRHADTP
jgi:uncharacterized membrane protein YdjX (TVP38/TMEM64 family)